MKRFNPKSITNKIIAFGLSIALITFIFALLIFSSSVEQLRTTIHEHNQRIAVHAAESLDLFLRP